jgi:hypothetical protein
MDELEKILSERLDPDNPAVLKGQLVTCEAWAANLALKHRAAERELSEQKRNLMVFDKDEAGHKMTEDLRKVRLDGLTAEYKEKASLYGDLADVLKRRISLGQTMLKSIQEEMKL